MPQTSWLCEGDAKQRGRSWYRASAGHQKLSVSVSMGNNRLLEQGLIDGTHASWPGLRGGEISSAHGLVPLRFPRVQAGCWSSNGVGSLG